MSKVKLARVLWVDSTTTTGWRDSEQIREPQTIETIGWLVKTTKNSVSISAHYGRDPQGYAHCDVMTIPRGAIRSFCTIKLKETKRG